MTSATGAHVVQCTIVVLTGNDSKGKFSVLILAAQMINDLTFL